MWKMLRRFLRLKCLFSFVLIATFYWLLFPLISQDEPNSLKVNQVVPLLHLDLKNIRHPMKKVQEAREKHKPIFLDLCPIERLPENEAYRQHDEVSCKQHTMSESSCKYVTKEFAYDFQKHSCGEKELLTICKYLENSEKFKCNSKACGENFDGDILIHLMDIKSGIVRPIVQRLDPYNLEEIERNVLKYALITLKQGNEFLFLSCGYSDNTNNRTQLIMLDKEVMLHYNQKKAKNKKHDETIDPKTNKPININVVFLDSISRAHFYRSLRKTTTYLKDVRLHSKSTEILDFELYQSIHGHTTENLFAFFNGKIFPPNVTDQDREMMIIQFQTLLKFVKKKGYKTLYQEDLCWQGFYGLNSDLGNYQEWEPFFKEFKENSLIDDPGLTFAACKMIDVYEPKLKHIYNTPRQLCYNGINMDTYYLQHLTKKLKRMNDKDQPPMFSFSVLNLAHDPDGVRIQGLDKSLTKFFEEAVHLDNTLTIFFSDHGNTYTDFVYQELDGKYEQYHPTLFVVVPPGVKQVLGEEALETMRTNQKRLLNLIDVHHTIKRIVDEKHPEKGILKELPSQRTCGDLQMAMPNLCVCQGWDSPVENTTELLMFVEFALGTINNVINDASPASKCKLFVPVSFQNLLQRKSTEGVRMTFEVSAAPGKGSHNSEEKLNIVTSFTKSDRLNHFNAHLVSYDRISTFGAYRKCSDAPYTFRYCVCDLGDRASVKTPSFTELYKQVRTSKTYDILDSDLVEETIDEKVEDELALLTRRIFAKEEDKKYLVSVTFEVVNISLKHRYQVHLKFSNLFNLKPLSKSDCSGIVKPNGVRFLCVLGRQYPTTTPEFDIDFDSKMIV